MTKQQLIELRKVSYKPPPQVRCDTCAFYSHYGNHCCAIRIRGQIQEFFVHPAGSCELYIRKEMYR